MKKVFAGVFAVVLLVVLGALGFVFGLRPLKRPAPELHVEASPEKLARGHYLVENVSVCVHCHSQGDLTLFGSPPKPGTVGGGGTCLTPEQGFPGTVCAPNLTPDPDTGLGQWTDGEILRAVREGVSRDGRPLVSFMPYALYREMSDEDAQAVVAYLRTLSPLRQTQPPPHLNFPLSVIMRFMPKPLEGPVSAPSPKDSVAYGRYLVTVAGCKECHTPVNARHEPLPGRYLAGGQEFVLEKGYVVRSANLTPHETGLGGLSRDSFIGLFKQHVLAESRREVPPRFNTVMAWNSYAGMTEQDLGAIYDYLRTVPPVDNTVQKWNAPREF